MKHLFFILALILSVPLFSSCTKEEEDLTCNIEYDINLPQPILKIADAYVRYESLGQVQTEKIVGGRFRKNFTYAWEDDEIKSTEYDINIVDIYFELKVPESELLEGYKLLDDKNANFYVSIKTQHSYNKENNWNGTSSTSNSNGGDNVNFVFSEEQRSYEYTVNELMSFFNQQSYKPYWKISVDHKGSEIHYTMNFNLCQSEKK